MTNCLSNDVLNFLQACFQLLCIDQNLFARHGCILLDSLNLLFNNLLLIALIKLNLILAALHSLFNNRTPLCYGCFSVLDIVHSLLQSIKLRLNRLNKKFLAPLKFIASVLKNSQSVFLRTTFVNYLL